MVFENAFNIPRTSGRRLTPKTLAELILPTTFSELQPVWVYPGQAIAESREEDSCTEILTHVTEIVSDQAETTAAERSARCFHTRFDAVYGRPEPVESPRRSHKGGLRRTFATLEAQKEEDLGCATHSKPSGHVELLFDAEVPDACDEDLTFRSVFPPSTTFACVVLSRASEVSLRLSPTHELFDDSELKLQPTLAVNNAQDGISAILDHHASPPTDRSEEVSPVCSSKREGRSLIRTVILARAIANSMEEEDKKALIQTDYEQALRRISRPSFLPGINHLQKIDVRSAFVRYDDDIDNLYQATRSFLDDHNDGECGCLDGKPDVFRVPGENFLLPGNEGDLGLSIERRTAQSIFDVMDELVCNDMLDDDILTEASSELSDFNVDEFVETNLLDDTAYTWQVSDPSKVFDTASHRNVGIFELEQPSYAPSFSTVSSLFEERSDSHVSDMCAIDSDGSHPAQSFELSYVDADTQQLISYIALNQLLHMNEHEAPPRIYRNHDGTYASEVNPAKISNECLGGGLEVGPSDSPDSSRSNSSASRVRPGPSQRPQMPEHESRPRRQRPPHDLYSSNRSGQLSKPRLMIKTQLVPAPQLLATVEEEGLAALSSPLSDVSIEFADQRGFVVPLQNRCENFLDDYDDDDDDDADDGDLGLMFTDAIWHVSPDLALSQPDEISSAIPTPPPASGSYLVSNAMLEQFEIEINGILALMFDCINRGQMHELAALNSHLYQTLDAVPQDYPAMTAVRSLGVSVGILVERMVISTLTF